MIVQALRAFIAAALAGGSDITSAGFNGYAEMAGLAIGNAARMLSPLVIVVAYQLGRR